MEALNRMLGERIGEHILWFVPEVFIAGMLSSPGNYRTHIDTGECLAKIG